MSDEDKKDLNQDENKDDPKKKQEKIEKDKNRYVFITALVVLGLLFVQFFIMPSAGLKKLSYSEFYSILQRNPQTGKIVSCELIENSIQGKFQNGTYFEVIVPPGDLELIPLVRTNVPDFKVTQSKTFLKNMLYSLLPVLLLIAFFYFFVYRGASQGGGKILSFGKSRARQIEADKQKVTFKDVAGVEEAKDELEEIIAFLKDPKKFQRLGGKIPKGVLLMGPPGTGKTLLAKAVAGEAGVPFFSISGSDFVEMFVGVGASRVRDLFERGKKSAQTSGKGCIIFIDEVDAVGRQRFAGIGGGHDEREQTLNALLVEMDGFESQEGVILIGATNRPDVLDPALLRPGRFDRQIVVDRPDLLGREQILRVHLREVKGAEGMDLKRLARQTSGFSGADLANLVNEGALLAARADKDVVEQQDLEDSIEKVMAGPERRSRLISKKEKETVAYHESGHALVALLRESSDPVHKISIIPRGHTALGYTLQLPLEDRYLITEKELLDKICILLAGRAAEEIAFGETTTGASNDFQVATEYIHRMVCEFGMSDLMGNLAFGKKDKQVFLGRDLMADKNYSEKTAQLIDQEVKRIGDECKAEAMRLIRENRDKLDAIANALLEKEVLDGDEVFEIVGMERPRHADEIAEEEARRKAEEEKSEAPAADDANAEVESKVEDTPSDESGSDNEPGSDTSEDK